MKRELVDTARKLLGDGATTRADLRRAISTAYYAAFHALAELCADEIVGRLPERRALAEWTVYTAP